MLLKKRRSELLRLPAVPRTEPSPYETKLTFSNDPYNDPGYDFVEEQDDNYEHLPELREENETTTDNCKERMSVASDLDPKNLDDTYLEVMHSSNEESYELINDPVESTTTREENETTIDKERMSVASYLDPKKLDDTYLEVMHSSNEESYELINDSVESTTTRKENETKIDKERMSVASYLDPINPESNYFEVMKSSNDESNMNVNPYTELIKDSVESTDRAQVNYDVQENEEYSNGPEDTKHQEIDN
ncbi:uncharacterized protein LOC134276577 [Saccostrea cucullata]|uniref:uncharacterized protein LOC134276577 n=1 Tax=Saccostrea cuccullata TaxID=36930 RepID=UPI002ED0C6A7